MSDEELAELLKFSSPYELWIVNFNGLLERLICTFQVRVNQDIGTLKKGQIVLVDKVMITRTLKTVFIVENKGYYANHFDLIDQ